MYKVRWKSSFLFDKVGYHFSGRDANLNELQRSADFAFYHSLVRLRHGKIERGDPVNAITTQRNLSRCACEPILKDLRLRHKVNSADSSYWTH